jgi:tetratricopeptide (TPR) repeat protein
MEAVDRKRNQAAWGAQSLSVRVALNGYWAAMLALSFVAVLCFRLQFDVAALVALGLAFVVCPLLAFTDRVRFDGGKLWRTGLSAWLWRLFNQGQPELPLAEIEWVETMAMRALRSGGRVYYRYRCEVSGNGLVFSFASGGAAFRRLVRALFSRIDEAKLDARSLELRDHLVEPETLQRTLGRLALASEDLLKDTALPRKQQPRGWWVRTGEETLAEDAARGQLLRRAANELYVLGRLRESAEAFRRALRALPDDAWLIYEFARFLHSQAGVVRDEDLLRRGQAALRLAARRGPTDARLLARVGESFLEYGEAERAERMFRRALEQNPNVFRAAVGLAEIGLRRGQLAHVLHHYNGAAATAPDAALARLAQRETAYYQDLNSNEDYLETELTRLNWLEHLARGRQMAARVTLIATLVALLLPALLEIPQAFGWSIAASAWLLWFAALAGEKLLAQRSPPEDEEEQ